MAFLACSWRSRTWIFWWHLKQALDFGWLARMVRNRVEQDNGQQEREGKGKGGGKGNGNTPLDHFKVIFSVFQKVLIIFASCAELDLSIWVTMRMPASVPP